MSNLALQTSTQAGIEVCYCLRIHSIRTGKQEYAMAVGKMGSDTVNLVFNTAREPFKEMSVDYTSKYPGIDESANENRVRPTIWIKCAERDKWQEVDKQLDQVIKVSAKVIFPYEPYSSRILGGIALLCRTVFTNMNPAESTLSAEYDSKDFPVSNALSLRTLVPFALTRK